RGRVDLTAIPAWRELAGRVLKEQTPAQQRGNVLGAVPKIPAGHPVDGEVQEVEDDPVRLTGGSLANAERRWGPCQAGDRDLVRDGALVHAQQEAGRAWSRGIPRWRLPAAGQPRR